MLKQIHLIVIAVLAAGSLLAQPLDPSKIKVLAGPATAQLGNVAHIAVPAGFEFIDGETTRMFMKASGQPSSGQEVGSLSPTNEEWSVMFEFNESGYVKDDDKDKLDADKILASIKKGNETGNEERKRMGSEPIEVVGWEKPPHYDEATHNLEWAVRARSRGRDFLNYNTRLLGRKGVMEVVLICEPKELPTHLPKFKSLLAGYQYEAGQTYAEYKQGDKVAQYGLAALVVGGAAVGAAKLGLFAWLLVFLKKGWKVIVIAFVAVAAVVKKIIGKITGNRANDRL